MSFLSDILFKHKRLSKAVTLIEHTTDKKIIYSVYKILNSIDLSVDQELTRRDVKRLLNKGWKVSIINEQIKENRV